MPAISTTFSLSMEQENSWRREKRRGEWREEMGKEKRRRRRGCLIYWFNSCQCPSLSLSVRRANGACSPKHPDQITFSPNFSVSFLLSRLHLCFYLSLNLSLFSFCLSSCCIFLHFLHPLIDWFLCYKTTQTETTNCWKPTERCLEVCEIVRIICRKM